MAGPRRLRLAFIPIDPHSSCDEVAQSLREAGTRYPFVSPEHTEGEILGLLHECAEVGIALQELGVGLYVLR